MSDHTSAPPTGRARAAGLLCPVCRVDLAMSAREGVEIDYCPQCRGVWLDRGELDKILERNAAESPTQVPPAAPPPDYRRDEYRGDDYKRHDYKHHDYKPHKRKRSFLDDLFD